MIRALLLRGLLGLCLLASPLAQAETAPDFQLDGATAGSKISLQQLRGKIVYLDFWASWCVPCKRSFPWMNRMQQQYGAQGLQILAVNLDTRLEEAQKFLQDNPAQFALAFDTKGDSARQYAIKGMPSSVLIGADGSILQRHAGFNDDKAVQYEAEIKAALSKLKSGK